MGADGPRARVRIWIERRGIRGYRGTRQEFCTVLSDLVHGEVIGLAPERTAESLAGLLTCLDARQRAAVEAVCTDMHQPYLNAVAQVLPDATVVLDKFHVLQHAGAALDEVRRHEFFRAGPVMRRFGRGKRWLLLRRWKTVRGSKRQALRTLFAANRRLFKAYVLGVDLEGDCGPRTENFDCGSVCADCVMLAGSVQEAVRQS